MVNLEAVEGASTLVEPFEVEPICEDTWNGHNVRGSGSSTLDPSKKLALVLLQEKIDFQSSEDIRLNNSSLQNKIICLRGSVSASAGADTDGSVSVEGNVEFENESGDVKGEISGSISTDTDGNTTGKAEGKVTIHF